MREKLISNPINPINSFFYETAPYVGDKIFLQEDFSGTVTFLPVLLSLSLLFPSELSGRREVQ